MGKYGRLPRVRKDARTDHECDGRRSGSTRDRGSQEYHCWGSSCAGLVIKVPENCNRVNVGLRQLNREVEYCRCQMTMPPALCVHSAIIFYIYVNYQSSIDLSLYDLDR